MVREGLLLISLYRIYPEQQIAKTVMEFPDLGNLNVHLHVKKARYIL
jgi:hypothetical protein